MTEPFTLTGRRLPASLAVRVVTIAAGDTHRCTDADWEDALVVVERGVIELETAGGRRHVFPSGSVLCLVGLSPRVLHNPGETDAVLAGVSRVPIPSPGPRRHIDDLLLPAPRTTT